VAQALALVAGTPEGWRAALGGRFGSWTFDGMIETDLALLGMPASVAAQLDRLLGGDSINRLVLASGGHLRILLGLVMEVVTQAESLPVDDATVTAAIQQVRNGMLPLADDQRGMLRRVAASHELPLTSQADWDVVAPLLDQHFVLGYQNGDPWYDVHPLLHDEIDSAPATG